MKTFVLLMGAALTTLLGVPAGYAQQSSFNRLSSDVFDVVPPSDRVIGTPGEMRVQQNSCRVLPTGDTRRRIVDVVVQEWGFFGFPVADQGTRDEQLRRAEGSDTNDSQPRRRRRSRLSTGEFARVADSIAGYWAATPDGQWMVDRQNGRWNRTEDVGSRWRDPWSAAFVSWVMCESGLGDRDQFRRAIAHHEYIDQAIRARDGGMTEPAFDAYDIGEAAIAPGDLLCSARRPRYSTIAERRSQMGEGARTHCDVVVKVDRVGARIFAIGGNVGSTVSLKVLAGVHDERVGLRPVNRLFAHLKLRADPIEAEAFDNTPTIKALSCAVGFEPPRQLAVNNLTTLGTVRTEAC